jgi:hypothetical protein
MGVDQMVEGGGAGSADYADFADFADSAVSLSAIAYRIDAVLLELVAEVAFAHAQ